MALRIVDHELEAPGAEVVLGPGEDGLALLARRAGRPVAFGLHPAPPGRRLDTAALRALAEPEAGRAALADGIRDALVPPPAPSTQSVTVAICTRARPELLAPCLTSVLAVVAGAEPAVEVLVVDNDPPDDATARVVAAAEGVRRVVEPVPGLDFARNRALREARGEVVAFLDDDIVADPGWLDGLREALAEDPEAGIVTGLVLPFALATPAQVTFERRGGFRRGTRKLRYAGDRLPGNPLFPFGSGMFGAGANMAVRREVVLGLGGFDEALDTGPPLPGGGDLDVFTRVLRAGHPLVYEPRMLVFHRHRPERAALRRQYRSWGEGFMAYVAKTHAADPAGRERLRALVAWWVRAQARELARAALGRSWGPPGYVLEETAGGIAGLAGGYARSRRRSEALRRAHA